MFFCMLKSYVTNLCDIAHGKKHDFYSYLIRNKEKIPMFFFRFSNDTYV